MFLISLLLIPTINCVTIEYRNVGDNIEDIKTKKLEADSHQVKLDDTNLDPIIFSINIQKYKGPEQVYSISNFPRLDTADFDNIGQNVVPVFTNLPKLNYINMDRNKLVYLPKDALSKTPASKIYLRHNMIFTVEAGSFGNNVKEVNLDCNMVTEIHSNWFQAPEKLTTLYLSGNSIEVLEENLFKDFTSLTWIYFKHNKLKSIGSGVFPNRQHFKEINLGFNNLKTLPSNAFPERQFSIGMFDIRFNNLSFIPKVLMDRMIGRKTPLIDGNPWQCSCYHNEIIKWVNWNTYGIGAPKTRNNEPRCVEPKAFGETCIENVDHEILEFFAENSSPPSENRQVYCE